MNIEQSPTKSNRSSLFKRFRVNVMSKYIPADFFPESFSQSSRRNQTNSSGDSPIPILKKLRSQSPSVIQKKYTNNSQAKEMKGLRKRLIQLKQICQKQYNIPASEPIKLLDHKSKSKENQKKLISSQKVKNQEKPKTPLHKKQIFTKSKNLENYMKKMKQFIDIDLKLQQDDPLNPERKYSNIQNSHQQNSSSKNSQILTRQRAKSQRTSREKLQSLSKVNKIQTKFMQAPVFKMKKIQNSLKESKIAQASRPNRYNEFINMNLGEDGMLTFYGGEKSPETKTNYNPKKYKVRLSLPKLPKKEQKQ